MDIVKIVLLAGVLPILVAAFAAAFDRDDTDQNDLRDLYDT